MGSLSGSRSGKRLCNRDAEPLSIMRLNGVEPSRVFPPTRPSTLRVYQFRHSRLRAVDSRCSRPAGAGGLQVSGGGGTLRTGVRTCLAPGKREKLGIAMVDLDLTKRQKEIFDFIRKYAAKTGYPPTVREIGKAVGLHSSSTVHAHLANLEKLGVLKRDPTKPRALEVLVDKAKGAVLPSGLPLVGQVAAGSPVLAEENIEEYLQVPGIAGGEEGEFILEVKGDSMVKAGILEGDHVIVRKQETAKNGEIVVALVGEEATVKRFFREKDHVRLQPENDALEPILTREVELLGRVVGVCRRVS